MRVFYMSLILSTALAAPAGSVNECSGDTENMDILEVNDGPTDNLAAGIGAEFESQAFYWISPGCSDDDTNAAKKKLVAGRQGKDWMLTADTGSGEAKLQAEYILDGQTIKVGTGQAKIAGEAIAADLVVVMKNWFKSRPNGIDPTEVTDDVLAFCSMVLTYAKSATNPLKPDESPKLRTTFMPWTDFNTLYKQVHEKLPGDIFNLFNTLACYKLVRKGKKLVTGIDRNFCSGTPDKPLPGKEFSELEFSNPAACDGKGKMSTKSRIENLDPKSHSKDELSVFDESIDGSIGELGSKMEKMWNSDREVPLFEFRDLFDTTTSEIAQFMQTIDENIQSLHTKYEKAPSS